MENFLIYIAKSSICLVLFYLFYRVLLSKETFYRFNRILLLSVIALSVIIPIIEIPATEKYTGHTSTEVTSQNTEKENEVYLWMRNISAQTFSGTIQNLPNVPSDDATKANDAYYNIVSVRYQFFHWTPTLFITNDILLTTA